MGTPDRMRADGHDAINLLYCAVCIRCARVSILSQTIVSSVVVQNDQRTKGTLVTLTWQQGDPLEQRLREKLSSKKHHTNLSK